MSRSGVLKQEDFRVLNQGEFITAANQYLLATGKGDIQLNNEGVCEGLACTWLEYCKKYGVKNGTINLRKNLDEAKKMASQKDAKDRPTSPTQKAQEDIMQSVIKKAQAAYSSKHSAFSKPGQVLDAQRKFNSAFPYAEVELEGVLKDAVHEKQLFLVFTDLEIKGEYSGHATAVFKEDSIYYFYDPNADSVIPCKNTNELVSAILSTTIIPGIESIFYQLSAYKNDLAPSRELYPSKDELAEIYQRHFTEHQEDEVFQANMKHESHMLFSAIIADDAEALKLFLLNLKTDMNRTLYCLYFAALKGSIESMNLLIDIVNNKLRDANTFQAVKQMKIVLNHTTEKGENVLHLAMKAGRLDILKAYLKLDHKFDLENMLTTKDIAGKKPIEYAPRELQFEIMELLEKLLPEKKAATTVTTTRLVGALGPSVVVTSPKSPAPIGALTPKQDVKSPGATVTVKSPSPSSAPKQGAKSPPASQVEEKKSSPKSITPTGRGGS
jgi:hypothetical protein